jgi:hypothetical protein
VQNIGALKGHFNSERKGRPCPNHSARSTFTLSSRQRGEGVGLMTLFDPAYMLILPR